MKKEVYSFDTSKVEEKLKNVKSLSDLTGSNGVIQEIIKGTVERILQAEQEAHLGYEPYKKKGKTDNARNGYSKKTMKTSSGQVDLDIPRDRKGTFDPQFVQKHQSFDPDLEKRVVSMYARGMSTRDIGQQLADFYGVEVSAPLISKITDKVLEGITEWQARALEDVYAVVFMDAIHYKIRQDGKVISKAAYTCMGVDLDGKVDVLGLWIAEAEGAHFWQSVLNDLRTRGVKDILIACVDGLKGFPEAIETIFPNTMVQLCVVHQIRTSLRYLASKHHKEFAGDLKEIYRASTLENAEAALAKLEEKWGSKCPAAVSTWRAHWTNLSTFFLFPEDIRRMIYTTNAVEALHRQFRKVTKTKGSFPTDDALKKMLYLATLDLKGSFRSKREWPVMLSQLKLVFGDRIPQTVS
ncbi:MAG: IS256 family transposase [Bdellovibrionaceae bacterium]|nr:IS256 family transposase [Pseudobdellovibrionaceae bacterium]